MENENNVELTSHDLRLSKLSEAIDNFKSNQISWSDKLDDINRMLLDNHDDDMFSRLSEKINYDDNVWFFHNNSGFELHDQYIGYLMNLDDLVSLIENSLSLNT